MPRFASARIGAVLCAAVLPSCHASHSVYIADRIAPDRIHFGARAALAREGLKEKSWNQDTLSGEYASEKPPRRLVLVLRPLGDGWNLDLRCYGPDGVVDKRETGRLRDRLLTALSDEGLPAREGPF